MSLELKDISLERSGNIILSNISISVSSGKKLCLLGESGSGKTSLLMLVAGVLRPSSGQISYNDFVYNSERFTKTIESSHFAFMMQELFFMPSVNVYENLFYLCSKNSGVNSNLQIEEYLKKVHLEGFEKRSINSLSFGEKRRLALIRAMLSGAELLILDDPFMSLSGSMLRDMSYTFKKESDEKHFSSIMAISNFFEAKAVRADYVVILKNGKIEQEGSLMDVEKNPKNKYVEFILQL